VAFMWVQIDDMLLCTFTIAQDHLQGLIYNIERRSVMCRNLISVHSRLACHRLSGSTFNMRK